MAGGFQFKVTCPFPADAVRSCGAVGAVGLKGIGVARGLNTLFAGTGLAATRGIIEFWVKKITDMTRKAKAGLLAYLQYANLSPDVR